MAERGVAKLCAFCRTPGANSDEEDINRLEKLMEKGNGGAFYQLAGYYADGKMGMPQNRAKANELYLKGSWDVPRHISTGVIHMTMEGE